MHACKVMASCEELTGVQALYDGRGINKVASAQWTCEVLIQICDFNPVGLHFIHLDRSAEETHNNTTASCYTVVIQEPFTCADCL